MWAWISRLIDWLVTGTVRVCDESFPPIQILLRPQLCSIVGERMEPNLLDWCDRCGNSFQMPACIQYVIHAPFTACCVCHVTPDGRTDRLIHQLLAHMNGETNRSLQVKMSSSIDHSSVRSHSIHFVDPSVLLPLSQHSHIHTHNTRRKPPSASAR